MTPPMDKIDIYYGAVGVAAALLFICMAYEFSEAQLIWAILRHPLELLLIFIGSLIGVGLATILLHWIV